MLVLIIRTFLLYIFIFLALKSLGKRQIGELEPIELVVILIISEAAAVAMQSNEIPLLYSIVPTTALCILQIFISLINLKSQKVRNFVYGTPSVIIKNGKIDQKALRRERLNLNDLMEQLRSLGIFNVCDVEYALIENNGQITAFLQTAKRPLTVSDLFPEAAKEKPPYSFIFDGYVNKNNLRDLGLDENWLRERLKENNIKSPAEVFIAGLDNGETFYYQLKDKKEK